MPELYKQKNPVVNDAFDRLMAGIHKYKSKENYRTYTVTGCHPGAGTTSIAISLAISMAVAGERTILVDADMRKDMKDKRLNQNINIGLSEYLSSEVTLTNIVCSTNIDNLVYIASGGFKNNNVELLCSDRFSALHTTLKEYFDVVIFDVPALTVTVDAGILAAKTDAVVLVVGQNRTKTTQIKAALRELNNVGGNFLGVVLNNVDKYEYRRYSRH